MGSRFDLGLPSKGAAAADSLLRVVSSDWAETTDWASVSMLTCLVTGLGGRGTFLPETCRGDGKELIDPDRDGHAADESVVPIARPSRLRSFLLFSWSSRGRGSKGVALSDPDKGLGEEVDSA